MAYEVTARRWRPQDFESVIGQGHVTTTLKNAIQTGQIAHAYLFSGPRGVGKTTTARILAKALNCVNGPTVTPCNECSFCREISEGRSVDVLEIDGASNNKVEQVRSHLVESVNYTPSQGKHKIYIIDEVHMLSTAAFNALLKTLEEPPAHVYFIFATTDPQKVLATILSRCQRFDFRRMSGPTIVDHLSVIAERSGYTVDQDALSILARRADGSMRDAESLFDQSVAFGGTTLTASNVAAVLGLVEQDVYFDLVGRFAGGDVAEGLKLIEDIVHHGYNVNEISIGIIEHLRNLLITKAAPEIPDLLGAAVVDHEKYKSQAERFSTDDLDRLILLATNMESAIKSSALPKVQLEIGIVRMIRMEQSVLLASVMQRLTDMAAQIADPEAMPVTPTLTNVEPSPTNIREPSSQEQRASTSPTEAQEESTSTLAVQQEPDTTPSQPVSDPEPSPDPPQEIPDDDGTLQDANNTEIKLSEQSQALEDVVEQDKTQQHDLNLQVAQNAWPTAVSQIKEQRPAIGSFAAAAMVSACDGSLITLAFSSQHDFHQQQADKNSKVIEDALGVVLGMPVKIKITTSEHDGEEAGTSLLPTEPLTEVNANTITGQDPVVKRFIDAFDGKIISDS
ncbi:MAG: DNA polymerase III subunit gamma/tau [Candidatus Latescibacteria bacterium]|nr:DNA polymerase III subunit gamma/tau [Candidatus Latescibacterota bacterium]